MILLASIATVVAILIAFVIREEYRFIKAQEKNDAE